MELEIAIWARVRLHFQRRKMATKQGWVGWLEFSEWKEKPASSAYINNDNWF